MAASDNWPASLPQYPQAQGYEEEYQKNYIESQVDFGPKKRRQRLTKNLRSWKFQMIMTTTQKNTLVNFLNTTLASNTDKFTWPNWLQDTGDDPVVRMKEFPKFTPLGASWVVNFEMEEMPA